MIFKKILYFKIYKIINLLHNLFTVNFYRFYVKKMTTDFIIVLRCQFNFSSVSGCFMLFYNPLVYLATVVQRDLGWARLKKKKYESTECTQLFGFEKPKKKNRFLFINK